MWVSKRKKYAPYQPDQQAKKENFNFMNSFAAKGQVVLTGDSITDFYPVLDFFRDYTQRSGLTVYNRGIGGDISLFLKERLASNVLAIRPKQIVILIGTNDIERGYSSQELCGNVEDMFHQARELDPDVSLLLQAIYPVNGSVGYVGKRTNSYIQECNAQLAVLADRLKVPFLDLTAALSDEKGDLRPDFTYDGLHLNARGYEVVTTSLLELLL